jgi:hypothetical protein
VNAAQEVRLSDLSYAIAITRGIPTRLTTPDDSGIPVLSMTNLRQEVTPERFFDPEALGDTPVHLPGPGDVLVSIEGPTVGDTLTVVDAPICAVSQQVAVFEVIDESRILPWFLGACLATDTSRAQLLRLASGTAIRRIALKDLGTLTIPLPDLATQRRIADRFASFQQAIHAHQQIIDYLEFTCTVDFKAQLMSTAESSVPSTKAANEGNRKPRRSADDQARPTQSRRHATSPLK